MKKKDIEDSIVRTCGGHLVTIAEVCKWSHWSREYVKQHILKGLMYYQKGTSKYYFAADIAEKIATDAVA